GAREGRPPARRRLRGRGTARRQPGVARRRDPQLPRRGRSARAAGATPRDRRPGEGCAGRTRPQPGPRRLARLRFLLSAGELGLGLERQLASPLSVLAHPPPTLTISLRRPPLRAHRHLRAALRLLPTPRSLVRTGATHKMAVPA